MCLIIAALLAEYKEAMLTPLTAKKRENIKVIFSILEFLSS